MTAEFLWKSFEVMSLITHVKVKDVGHDICVYDDNLYTYIYIYNDNLYIYIHTLA